MYAGSPSAGLYLLAMFNLNVDFQLKEKPLSRVIDLFS
jgi:hypothetical protein